MAQYIFDKQKLIDNVSKLKDAFNKQDLNFEIHYSVKTNFSDEVLETINQECKFEIVSADEWDKIKVFNPKTVVLNGPSKTQYLAEDILKSGVEKLYFNTDNDTDLEILDSLGNKYADKLIVGLRVYFNKSGIWNRFGFDIESERTKEIFLKYQKLIKGFHFHFSTNNFNLSNYENILDKITHAINEYNLNIEFIDIGGGLPSAGEELYSSQVYEKLPKLISDKTQERFFIISEVGRNIVEDRQCKIWNNGEIHCMIQKTIKGKFINALLAFKDNHIVSYIEMEKIALDGNGATWFGKMTSDRLLYDDLTRIFKQSSINDCILEVETILLEDDKCFYVYEVNYRTPAWIHAATLNGQNILGDFLNPKDFTVFNTKEAFFGRETMDFIRPLEDISQYSNLQFYSKGAAYKNNDQKYPSEIML